MYMNLYIDPSLNSKDPWITFQVAHKITLFYRQPGRYWNFLTGCKYIMEGG